ncbi:MAG: hypothetical protein QOE86_2135 [Solirubrobacteraceae bacterium]|nr:hypothetical protein [Solirubrobacteraceae bacterium]
MIGAIVLGILAGFIGRLLMPGKDKMGFLATIVLGIAGAALGFLVFTVLLGIGDNKAFDLGGLPGAVLGVIVLLWVYRRTLRDKRDRGAERRRDRMRPSSL